MLTITRAADLHAWVADMQRSGRRIGLVPTMGNLHAGHYSLVDAARANADVVAASIFVNPTQFGPGEDFDRYPRTPGADAEGLAARGCDLLFLPAVEDIYPYGAAGTVRVCVPELGGLLEGAMRPGHFDGVATVVAKLFNLVRPDAAAFGQKDYQQLLVVRRMARDLGYPVRIICAPIVREANGLAMSSRNQYLDAAQRARAGAIHACLQWMCEQVRNGSLAFAAIEDGAREQLERTGLGVDYVVIRRAADLGPATRERDRRLVALVAARMGATRLIDNFLMDA